MSIPMTDQADSSQIVSRASELSVLQLQTFQRVYELEGYAAAARDLEISVPTVWQQVQTVQRLYGFALFEKKGRRIIPTASAKRLYERLSELLAGLDSTFEIGDENHSESQPIRLVTGVRMMMEDLSEPLGDFRKAWNNPLTIRHGNDRIAAQMVLADEIDLALTLEPGYDQVSSRLHIEPAYQVEFLAVCKKGHPFASAKKFSLRELVKHDLIVTSRGTHGREALDHALHKERLKARITAETDNSGFTVACVRAGLGVGILAGRSGGELCRRLEVRSLGRLLGRREIVFMWKKGRRLTPPMQSLVDAIRNTNREQTKKL